MCPRGDSHKVVEIQIETSTKMYTPFLSDLISNMDHTHISGTEPSVIFSQICSLKSWKVPKQAEAKRDGVINPQIYNFNQF